MDEKAQGSFEYILLIGGALLFVLIVIAILRTEFFTEVAGQTGNRTLNYYDYLNQTQGNFTNGT